MSLRDEILARFIGEGSAGPFYLPDLTLWYKWHQGKGTLPSGYEDFSLPQVARAMGIPVWLPVLPGRVETPGFEIRTTESEEERIIQYETSVGTLVARWILGPDGDWWQTEYPVKRREDLKGILELAQARTYVLAPDELERTQTEVGEDGAVAIEIPRRPYSDLLHEFLGWSDGLLYLREPIIAEVIATLEAKLQRFVEQVAPLAGDVVLSPDNLDGQFISPKAFEQYLSESYRLSGQVFHTHGKRMIVHIGGPIRHLVTPLAEAGVDGFEGVSGPPQSDLSLAQAREVVGLEPLLWGGIPQDFLLDAREPDQFEAAVRLAVHEARGDRRVILGVADRVPVNAVHSRLEAIPTLVQEASEA